MRVEWIPKSPSDLSKPYKISSMKAESKESSANQINNPIEAYSSSAGESVNQRSTTKQELWGAENI